VLAIKLVINTVIIYIKPIDAAFTSFKRDLTRKDRVYIGKENMSYMVTGHFSCIDDNHPRGETKISKH
jgi:hypothetical protein